MVKKWNFNSRCGKEFSLGEILTFDLLSGGGAGKSHWGDPQRHREENEESGWTVAEVRVWTDR